LHSFLKDIEGLGDKVGPLLIQLPPSLAFEPRVARTFFKLLRDAHPGTVVCEPRHVSWFLARADEVLFQYRINRVAADPAPHPASREPSGWLDDVLYYRLHGSPRKYWSAYSREYVDALAREFALAAPSMEVWCIFDNTASGAAAGNALQLRERLR